MRTIVLILYEDFREKEPLYCELTAGQYKTAHIHREGSCSCSHVTPSKDSLMIQLKVNESNAAILKLQSHVPLHTHYNTFALF